METRVRKNTVKLVCSSGSRTPAHLEVLKFALQHLKIPAADIHSVYRDENENRFYLKFIDEAKFSSFMRNIEETYTFHYDDGTVTRAHLEMASCIFRYVRIFSLPPEIDDKEIAHVLGQFGTIRQHVRERYAAVHGVNIYTGIRGVHMEVAKEIPPHLYIGHHRARIFYDGLKNRCFHCKAEGHVKADCMQMISNNPNGGSSKNSNAHTNASVAGGSSSYANVTALGEGAKRDYSTNTSEQPQNTPVTETMASPSNQATSSPSNETGPEEAGLQLFEMESEQKTVEKPSDSTDPDTMEIDDEKKAAQKRALTSSSEDDTVKGAAFTVVHQKKGKVDAKKGKLDQAKEPTLPSNALEKRSSSKNQLLTSGNRATANTSKRSK